MRLYYRIESRLLVLFDPALDRLGFALAEGGLRVAEAGLRILNLSLSRFGIHVFSACCACAQCQRIWDEHRLCALCDSEPATGGPTRTLRTRQGELISFEL